MDGVYHLGLSPWEFVNYCWVGVDDFSPEGGEPSVPRDGVGYMEQVKTRVASCKVSMSVPPHMHEVGVP